MRDQIFKAMQTLVDTYRISRLARHWGYFIEVSQGCSNQLLTPAIEFSTVVAPRGSLALMRVICIDANLAMHRIAA